MTIKMKYRRKKGPVQSKKKMYRGTLYASGLEVKMVMALEQEGIKFQYEPVSFTLQEAFKLEHSAFERQSNGKGEFKDRGNCKVQAIKYTPDFVGKKYIIECKGRANDAFPIRFKMFKKHISDSPYYKQHVIFKPQNIKECLEVAKVIKEKGLG